VYSLQGFGEPLSAKLLEKEQFVMGMTTSEAPVTGASNPVDGESKLQMVVYEMLSNEQ
jgi:hypothetical protein